MMRTLAFFLLSFFSTLNAQSSPSNSVYLEVFGNGGFYSLNYERLIINFAGVRAGFSYIYLGDIGQYISFPLMINGLLGSKHHKLEIGAGVTIMNEASPSSFKSWDTQYFKTASIGYRFQKRNVVYKISFTPLFNNKELIPIGGFAFGYRF